MPNPPAQLGKLIIILIGGGGDFFVILYNIIQYNTKRTGDFLISYLLRLHHVILVVTDVTLNKQLPMVQFIIPVTGAVTGNQNKRWRSHCRNMNYRGAHWATGFLLVSPSFWHHGNHLMTFTRTSGLESGLNSIWRDRTQSADKASTWYHEPN